MRSSARSFPSAAALLCAAGLASSTLDAQPPASRLPAAAASPTAAIAGLVRPAYSGERAKETVAYLDQFVRWPGNRGFDASIAHIAERLEAAGYVRDDQMTSMAPLTYRIERYQMPQPAWEPLEATLSIEGEVTPVLRFTTNRNMLATNSFSTPAGGVRAELVDAGRGTPAELDRAGVRGKIVFVNANVGRVFDEAVTKRGALGVLGYSLPDYLQPEKNRTSIQFGRVARDTAAKAWGIALSYEARERVRAAIARGRASGPVRVHVSTQVAWTHNAVEQAVIAEVRGRSRAQERFVFSAHVQEPGANDNASGVGAQVEMARVAADLMKSGRIAPARTITMLWGLEISSTARYIQQDSVRAQGIKWGLSLDMVGEDTDKTGGTFLIEKMPDPSAIWTRGEDKHSEWGGRPLKKEDMTPHYFNDFVLGRALEQAATNGWVVKTNPFEGGSDHTPFLGAKIPGLLFWHFTDQFYHTDNDRLDMVSANELKNVGVTALVSAIALTSADAAMTTALVKEVTRAAVARLETEAALSADAMRAGGDAVRERDILRAWADWYRDALGTFRGTEVGGTSAGVESEIVRAQRAIEDAHRAAVAKAVP